MAGFVAEDQTVLLGRAYPVAALGVRAGQEVAATGGELAVVQASRSQRGLEHGDRVGVPTGVGEGTAQL
ncbi:MAG TPA: hypothetical protein VF653_09115, partial [Methylomirabilota bacterium]